MARAQNKVDRIIAIVFVALLVVVLGYCGFIVWHMVRRGVASAGDIHFARPDLAIRDARALIADRAAHRENYGDFTEPGALPESLRIPNLRYAKIHDDHVDLVIARNPDSSFGARIWSARHRPHRDTPTKHPDIWFFRYTHERPETPDNIR